MVRPLGPQSLIERFAVQWFITLDRPGRRTLMNPKESPAQFDLAPHRFTATLKAKGVRTNALPVASPNLNGRCERFIQTIKYECLFKFILFGKRHLDHVVIEWVDYYNGRRSHMERDHLPPIHVAPEVVPKLDRDQIMVRSYVGGLVKSFERKAA